MKRSSSIAVQIAIFVITVAAAVALSMVFVGSWMPGLPLGVLAGIAVSALAGALITRRSSNHVSAEADGSAGD